MMRWTPILVGLALELLAILVLAIAFLVALSVVG